MVDDGQIPGSILALDAIFTIVFMALILAWSLRRSRRHMAPSITRQLRETGHPYVTRLAFLDQTWNPTPGPGRYKLIGPGTPIMGPGTAVYSLDEAGRVHLAFTPKGGHEQHFSGPMPQATHHPSLWHATHGLARWLLVVDVALLICGAVTGFVLSSGTLVNRLGGAGIGFFIGMVATVAVTRIFLITVSVKVAPKSPSESGSPHTESRPVGAEALLRQYESDRRIAQRYLDEHHGPR
jgi:hypothetical protein